jgi:hypothetical protein
MLKSGNLLEAVGSDNNPAVKNEYKKDIPSFILNPIQRPAVYVLMNLESYFWHGNWRTTMSFRLVVVNGGAFEPPNPLSASIPPRLGRLLLKSRRKPLCYISYDT